MSARFTFARTDVVPASVGEVAEVLLDLEHYPQWWPQVRAVARLDDDHALVVVRSRLPYSLDLELTAVSRSESVLEVSIEGDLRGHARWELTPVSGGTRLAFTQEVSVVGPLAWASLVARPVLAWNHTVMMRGGLDGLRRRLSVDREGRSSARPS